jgi:hypothetical protein
VVRAKKLGWRENFMHNSVWLELPMNICPIVAMFQPTFQCWECMSLCNFTIFVICAIVVTLAFFCSLFILSFWMACVIEFNFTFLSLRSTTSFWISSWLGYVCLKKTRRSILRRFYLKILFDKKQGSSYRTFNMSKACAKMGFIWCCMCFFTCE